MQLTGYFAPVGERTVIRQTHDDAVRVVDDGAKRAAEIVHSSDTLVGLITACDMLVGLITGSDTLEGIMAGA